MSLDVESEREEIKKFDPEDQGYTCYWVGPGKCSRCFDVNGQLKNGD